MTDPLGPSRRMTAVERAIALRDVEAFRSVPMEQLAHVAAVSREERFAEGAVFFREGDPPGGLLVVLEGAVRLERGGKVLGEAVAGETLGAWSLFDEHRRRATAMAARDTRVLILEREAFYEVLSEHVEIVKSMFRDLVHRLLALAGPADEETR